MNAAVNTVSSFYAERLKLIFRKYILMQPQWLLSETPFCCVPDIFKRDKHRPHRQKGHAHTFYGYTVV